MKRTKRLIGLAALLALPAGAMTNPGTLRATSCAITPLRVTGWEESAAETLLLQQGIAAFNRLNRCIVARYSATTQPDYQQELQREFSRGLEPDVFYASPDMIATEGSAGLLLKLDPYLASDHVSLGSYMPALLKLFQVGGSTYGLPKDWGTAALLYDKNIFSARHVPYPTNTLTYDQYRALAKQLTTINPNPAKTIYGTAMPDDFNLLLPFLYGFGTRIFDPVANRIQFDNARAIQALAYYTGFQLVDRSAMAQPEGRGTAIDSLGSGQVAMIIDGSWQLPYLRSEYPHLHVGVAEIPIGPAGRAAPVFTNAWSASARTPHPAAATQLVAYLSGASFQRQQLHLGFALPTIAALQADPYLKTHPDLGTFFKTYAAGQPVNFGRYDSVVQGVLADAVTAVLLKGATPSQAIAGANRTLQTHIASQ